MDECPDWDILIIMLERRNILASRDIQPIKKLSLPTTCPPNISQLLPGLLAGKWVQRPSNFELSHAANAKDILNTAKPGCLACLRILRTCDQPFNVAKIDAQDTSVADLECYPLSEDGILATWQQRAEVWEELCKRPKRMIRCSTQKNRDKTMKTFDAYSSPHIPLPEDYMS
ncbi:hypothetical protein CPB86DRAFT_312750 [Serendipita vermifera]|nr:hypothetical protein CPB86DRAFT_312750 [Serendipita vermifera]